MFLVVTIRAATTIAAVAKPAAAPMIMSSELDKEGVVDFEVPTAIGVPVKADAGIIADTVCGDENVVTVETQMLPFQYSIMLDSVTFEFVMFTVAGASGFKASPFEVTLTSKNTAPLIDNVPVPDGWLSP